jgi:glycosyltransferase involved in cell wall biosynthesis
MNITIICYNHFDATISLAKYLPAIKKDVKVTFICLMSQTYLNVEILTLKGSNVKNGFVSKNVIAQNIDKEIIEYLKDTASFEVFVFNSYKLADIENFKLLHQLKINIINSKPDVLHFVGNNRLLIILEYLLRRYPHVHTLHEPYPFSKISPYRLLRHRFKIWLLLASKGLVIVPSVISYNRFKLHFKINGNRLTHIPFGIFEIFKCYARQPIKKASDLIVYYGHISKYKGIEVLINAMRYVSTQNSNLKLIIAGSGSLGFDMPTDNDNVTVINKYLSNHEVAKLNQLATVIVCPYISASQSGVLMTSYAFDNPIIATNVGALAEVIEDNITGKIVAPNNPEKLAAAIIDLFAQEDKIKEMRANIKFKYANSDLSWLSIANETYLKYQQQMAK